MIDPAPFDAETTPAVALAGRLWPIPELVWRDLKKCRRALIDFQGRLNEAVAASNAAADPDEDAALRGERHMAVMSRLFDGLSDEDCDRLVMGPLLAGLQAAHPALTKAEFEGWPVTEFERQMAWLVVRRQSLLFMVADSSGDDDVEPAPGEGGGAA